MSMTLPKPSRPSWTLVDLEYPPIKWNQDESFPPLVFLPKGAKPFVDVQNVHILKSLLCKKLLSIDPCSQRPTLIIKL
ncbi:hypothetical protein BT93_F1199 [Corymbia citriodora subsp. variegata]|nr:hypothetical protein BT93_F1199 [Corymbia citriodora subsp. variegata]